MIVSLFSQDWSLPARRVPSSPSGSLTKERQAKGEVNMETMPLPGTPLLLYTGSAFMFMCRRNSGAWALQTNSAFTFASSLPLTVLKRIVMSAYLFHLATYYTVSALCESACTLDLILGLGFL